MKEKLDISEFDSIFKQQLSNATATPPAGVWEGISSALPAVSSASATVAVKTAVWIKASLLVLSTVITGSVVYVVYQNKTEKINPSINTIQLPLAEKSTLKDIPKVSAENEKNLNEKNLLIHTPQNIEKPKNKKSVNSNEVNPENIIKSNQQQNVIDDGVEQFKFILPENKKQVEILKNETQPQSVIEKESIEIPYEHNNEAFVAKIDSSFIFVPDVVTPNGDGLNDVYLIDIRGEESVRILIFDKRQNLVFETANKLVSWNCIMPNGNVYQDGSYIVKVIYKFPGQPEKTKNVTLKVIR